MKSLAFTIAALCFQILGFANSLNLLNDSTMTLTVEIIGADGSQLGQFVLNPRDATQWSDSFMNLNTDQPNDSLTPYTVNWYCMGGAAYGVCNDVPPGSLVTAQSCGGAQECP